MTALPMPAPWSWGGRGAHYGPGTSPEGGREHGGHGHGHGPHRDPRKEALRQGGPLGRLAAAWGGGPGGRHPGFPPQPPGPPGPPGPPWGGMPYPHNPFGGPFGGGRGRRRGQGPRARRGDVRTGILLLLAEEPRSGYEIIREGRERSGNAWRPSPGSVYPMLQQLEDEGLVRPAENAGAGRRRPFELTDEGHEYVENNATELTPPWDAVSEEYEDAQSRYGEISTLAFQLAGAAAQVAQAGSDEQVERAKRLLAETKRNLYRILAEDDALDRDGDEDADDDGSENPAG